MSTMRARNVGLSLAAVWFILTGLLGLVVVHFPAQGVLMSLLALLAGIFILAGR